MKSLKVLKFFLAAFLVASIFFLIFAWRSSGRFFGVEYTLNEDGESYTLSKYGVFNPRKTFEIPSTYQGKPVSGIGKDAFNGCAILKSIAIPDGVIFVDDGAFNTCTRLTSVTIGDSVTTIGGYAFAYCYSLASVTIPDSVKTIGWGAFRGCTSLASVTIGGSVTRIYESAFLSCDSLASVYYTGTEEDWGAIDIENGNTNLTYATRYYYSETAPTSSGNFWHYNASGEVEIWP